MKLRTIGMTGVLSLAGLGLVGAGAHAVFTQNTTSAQTINAGAMNVQLALTSYGTPATTLTLPATVPEGSTFTTGDQTVYIENYSNISVNAVSGSFGANIGNGLFNELNVCAVSSAGYVIYNGSLPGAYGNTYTIDSSPIAAYAGGLPGQGYYTVNYYAGTVTTGCGSGVAGDYVGTFASGTSTSNTLDASAEGLSVTPTVTVTYNG